MQKGGSKAGGALRLSFPGELLRGHSREPLRPPHPWPKAEHGAATSSFLFFKESPMAPQVSITPPV